MMKSDQKNRVDMLDDMTNDETVVFREFIRQFKGNENKCFFLLEGDDDINYYNRPFENHFGAVKGAWLFQVCNGRNNVISLVETLLGHKTEEYRNSLFFGFIDKDYHEVSDNTNKNRIYVTPGYSIENFYVSSTFMSKVLERKFFLKENEVDNRDHVNCLANFLERRNDFSRNILDLDIYLRCNRIMYEDAGYENKINAKEISLTSSINVGLDKVELKKNALDMLKKEAGDFDAKSLEEARLFYHKKNSDDLATLIRGKFMLFFMHQYLFRLKEDNLKAKPTLFNDSYVNSKLPKGNKKIFKKTKLTLTKENQDLLSDLSIFSDIPECLTRFLTENVNSLRFERLAS